MEVEVGPLYSQERVYMHGVSFFDSHCILLT